MTAKRFRGFFCITVLAISFAGCASRVAHVTNLPPGVTEQQAKNYDAVVGGLQKIALTTSTLRQTVITLRGAGVFPDDDAFVTALRAIAKIDEAQLAASAYLREAPEYFGEPQKQRIRDIFTSVIEQLKQLIAAGQTGIKNPDSLRQVNGLINELVAVVNLVFAITGQ